jgi:outer membrane protein assembly factor BamD (BamD/ComL family)
VGCVALTWAQEKRIDPRKLYEQGEEAFNKAQYNDALALFNTCLQENPGYADA